MACADRRRCGDQRRRFSIENLMAAIDCQVRPHDTLEWAKDAFEWMHTKVLPVLDDNNKPAGILTADEVKKERLRPQLVLIKDRMQPAVM